MISDFESDVWQDLDLDKTTEEEVVKLYLSNLKEIIVQQLTDLLKMIKIILLLLQVL